MTAFAGHRAAFIAAIRIKYIGIPESLQALAILDAEVGDQRLDAETAGIDAEFIPRYESPYA